MEPAAPGPAGGERALGYRREWNHWPRRGNVFASQARLRTRHHILGHTTDGETQQRAADDHASSRTSKSQVLDHLAQGAERILGRPGAGRFPPHHRRGGDWRHHAGVERESPAMAGYARGSVRLRQRCEQGRHGRRAFEAWDALHCCAEVRQPRRQRRNRASAERGRRVAAHPLRWQERGASLWHLLARLVARRRCLSAPLQAFVSPRVRGHLAYEP
mmetsp:Transcript_100506/g.290336  ORF Transcript_100506/g.290336 Transcript_100506/m.290336 type:complete len:217 (+) Transcript_100506:326-976(+)